MSDPLDPFTWGDDQHLIWHFFSYPEQSGFFPIQEWPAWAQIQAINVHKNDNEVFNFYYFLAANGVPAEQARIWTLAANVSKGKIVLGERYSKKEVQDANRILYKHLEGRLLTGKKRVFDLTAGRPLMW